LNRPVQILLLVASFPAMLGANELQSQWPTIQTAYYDILRIYPAVLWVMAILLVLLVVSIALLLLERQQRRKDRKDVIKSLTASQSIRLRKEIRQELQAELKSSADDLKRREVELAQRENVLQRDAYRIHSYEQRLNDKHAEVERLHIDIALKTEQLNFWLGQVNCAIEALVEDHESVIKTSLYLEKWVEKAATDPAGFAADITGGRFDPKRFERSKRQLDKIYERYAEIQRELGTTAKILNKGDADAIDQK
jgi:hypothetical protein